MLETLNQLATLRMIIYIINVIHKAIAAQVDTSSAPAIGLYFMVTSRAFFGDIWTLNRNMSKSKG